MTSPVDPVQIRLTGENSFIRLAQEEGGAQTARTSHWRVLWTPAGAGHVLFLKSDEVDGGRARVYSDNIAMTRYVQEEIESMLFPEFGDTSLPVISAEFRRSGGYFQRLQRACGSVRIGVRGAELARFSDTLHAQQPGRRGLGPHPRGVQLLLPGAAGSDYGGQQSAARRGVAGDARAGPEQHRVYRLVGDLGEAVGDVLQLAQGERRCGSHRAEHGGSQTTTLDGVGAGLKPAPTWQQRAEIRSSGRDGSIRWLSRRPRRGFAGLVGRRARPAGQRPRPCPGRSIQ